MVDQKYQEAWQEPIHADLFDARSHYSLERLKRVFENINEFRLFLEHKKEIRGRDFVEIGCATSELYRYLRRYHPEFRYRGFDISEPAIERARWKYPDGRFELCQADLSDVISVDICPAVVWARDVVHHQPDPFEFLCSLLPISSEVTILRIRTRDKGASVVDPELSCQYHYDHWVPYIILNIDETVHAICKTIPVRKMIIMKRYVQLGGWHNRFLPKDCYYPETGTAETSLYITRSIDWGESPEIIVLNRKDSDYVPPLILRGIDYLRQKFSS